MIRKLFFSVVLAAGLAVSFSLSCLAEPLAISGRWYAAPSGFDYAGSGTLQTDGLTPVELPAKTGGRYFFQSSFELPQGGAWVLDFQNTSTIGNFHHWLFDAMGKRVGEASGGIRSDSANPFLLHHGREFELAPGRYHLVTELELPFLIAYPQPYLDTLAHYQQLVNLSSILSLVCLGILLALIFYYATLGAIRRNVTDAYYAAFLLGNFLFNAASHGLLKDLFGWGGFYFIGYAILFSNLIYVLFVMSLLQIRRAENVVLHGAGLVALDLLLSLIVLAPFLPEWSLEMERAGVAVFLMYGLVSGVVRARQGLVTARWYLLAIGVFFLMGMLTISVKQMGDVYALGTEHLGLLAVTVEALLLSLVLARQFAEIRAEREQAITESFDKSRFLAAASHDLRQPMHALGLFIGELKDQVQSPQQIQLVGLLERSARAMSGLLDSLLDVSKLDAGLVKPRVETVFLQPMLARMTQEYVPMAEQHGVTLKIHGSMALVESDAVLLERVLLNLLSNAIRYTPKGGRVLLACRKRGSHLRIEVRDNGIGIPQDKQQDIFREFVQLGNVERSREKGLGLGLSIVERICRLLHYPLSLRSLPGKGAVFAVEIPLARDQSLPILSERRVFDRESVEAEANAVFSRARVLVVDDDELVLEATQRLLESWGCEVEVAASLMVARQLLVQQAFDLVISDYRLPDGTGFKVIQEVRRHHGKDLPCILISADTSTKVLHAAQTYDVHLLHKPIVPAKLRSLMHFLLSTNVF